MAPLHSFIFVFASLVLNSVPFVSAAPWIVTQDYQKIASTEKYGGYMTETTTIIEAIKPTATDMPLPLSTETVTTSEMYDGTATIVEVLYPTGAGTPTYYYDSVLYTSYYVNIVYTAASSCSQSAITTAVPVYIPGIIENMVPVTSVTTTVSVNSAKAFQPTTYTMAVAYVDPTQLPASSYSLLSAEYQPYTMYDTSCYYSYSSGSSNSDSSSSSSGSSYNYNDNYPNDYYGYGGMDPLSAILLGCLLGWFFLFFFSGLIENWVQFRRLMRGWQARRGLPITWCMLVPLLSLFLLFAFRKGYQARTVQEAEALQEEWNSMGFWKKIGLWLRWGFVFEYPPMLGPAPNKIGYPSGQPVAPTAPLLSVSPAHGANSDNGTDASIVAPSSEMSQVQGPGQSLQVPPRTRPVRPQQAPAPNQAPAQDDEITEVPSTQP